MIKSRQGVLEHFGLTNEFVVDATVELIKSEIDAARPMAVMTPLVNVISKMLGIRSWVKVLIIIMVLRVGCPGGHWVGALVGL